jgi:Spy/CpxP family protein refolding chaperone
MRALMEQLNLTPDQRQKLMPLLRQYMQNRRQEFEQRRSQMQSILSPQQMEKMKELRAQGMRQREIFDELNLTAEQRQRLMAMRKGSGRGEHRQQVQQLLGQTKGFLSADQQAKLEAFLSQRHGGGGAGQHFQRRQQPQGQPSGPLQPQPPPQSPQQSDEE